MIKENTKVGIAVLILAIGLGLSMLFLAVFTEIAEEALEQEAWSFDSSIIGFFNSIGSDGLDILMIVITELGSVWFLSAFSIATILYLWTQHKDKWGILFFILAVGGGGLLTTLLKNLYERGRPSINPEIDAIGFSFPSGHSMGSLIFYGFIIYFVMRSRVNELVKGLAISLMAVLVVLIGLSRIYLGAHFPSDVLAGYFAGAIWLILSILALEWIQWQSRSQVRPVHEIRGFVAKVFRAIAERLPAAKR
ncbi:phosphatase PAP2 family protein [Planococcus sp. FY231025]|uniref:phosphatase PAP2 family protein n=1 Tax=Planococcus sp. FY231025 TaxID=3455699 RepID=UPI003F93F08E